MINFSRRKYSTLSKYFKYFSDVIIKKKLLAFQFRYGQNSFGRRFIYHPQYIISEMVIAKKLRKTLQTIAKNE